ncbi:uncharacterized protein [Prorops nasuta]|uniref:uncharacterized protein n=1 Tax=Prorops nasuta TaxID=863751 RepID=UPI0034CE8210
MRIVKCAFKVERGDFIIIDEEYYQDACFVAAPCTIPRGGESCGVRADTAVYTVACAKYRVLVMPLPNYPERPLRSADSVFGGSTGYIRPSSDPVEHSEFSAYTHPWLRSSPSTSWRRSSPRHPHRSRRLCHANGRVQEFSGPTAIFFQPLTFLLCSSSVDRHIGYRHIGSPGRPVRPPTVAPPTGPFRALPRGYRPSRRLPEPFRVATERSAASGRSLYLRDSDRHICVHTCSGRTESDQKDGLMPRPKTSTGFIYKLSKADLAKKLASLQLSTEGNRDELRARLVEYHLANIEPNTSAASTMDEEPDFNPRQALEWARKSGIRFEGKDPLSFLEKIEELQESYQISEAELLACVPVLLAGQPLLWYRLVKEEINTWKEFNTLFRRQYLPARFLVAMEESIHQRLQKPQERILDYITGLGTLMHRHGEMSKASQLDRYYNNLQPAYRNYIKRREVHTLADLIELGQEFEINLDLNKAFSSKSESRKPRSEKAVATASPAYNSKDCCWNCGQRGHNRKNCKRPRKLFCSRCGKEGVYSRATHSYIGTKVFQECTPLTNPLQEATRLANGEKIPVTKTARLKIRIGKVKLNHIFRILPTLPVDVLLGLDFLNRIGFQWNTSVPVKACLIASEASRGLHKCSPAEKEKLDKMVQEELRTTEPSKKHTTWTQHCIRVKTGQEPIRQRYRTYNPKLQGIIDQELDKMLAEDVIEPSDSPWNSGIVLARKKDGKYRFCIDFRQVNTVTERDAYPLPPVQNILDKLKGARYLSTIDLKNGYWQIPLDPESRPITAFAIPGRGHYQFKVMPFGLHSAPATFQRLLDRVIGPAMEPYAFAYLDDIIVLGSTFEEHFQALIEVLRRLKEANLQINPEKCKFGQTSLRYLGHIIDQNGLHTDPNKVEAITAIDTPTNLHELRRFLGMVSWYRRFLPNVATTSEPLNKLLKKKQPWNWESEQENAFQQLKQQLTKAPILTCPDFSKEFTLQMDASDVG